MKTSLLFTLLFFLSVCSHAQITDLMYFPNGDQYDGDAKNIGQLDADLEDYGRVWWFTPFRDEEDYLTMVGFKLFTDEPLWVLTKFPDRIEEAINKFDLESYLRETFQIFTHRFEGFIEERKLTDIFILETLGQPDNRSRYFDSDIEFERWTFRKINTTFTFRNGVVISYVQIN